MKSALISQSNYIPWKGYFDAINTVDTFVVYDEMQYTRRDWRNRNKIKTAQGLKWLSIPVQVKNKFTQKINETVISDRDWNINHWNVIKNAYSKAPFFKENSAFVEKLYLNCNYEKLSMINLHFIRSICDFLEIETEIVLSSDYVLRGGKTEKLVNLCMDLEVTEYYSGPSAKDYMETKQFEKMNINVHWLDYSNYKEYSQLFDPFEHGVTILDLIFNQGEMTKGYMKSFTENSNDKNHA